MASTSFANNFWGPTDDGAQTLLGKLRSSRQTLEEIHAFYKERIAIEEEYAKRMSQLARKAVGERETGTLKRALEQLRLETEQMGKSHQTQAQQLRNQTDNPAQAFLDSFKVRYRAVENTVEKLLKLKSSLEAQVERNRSRFEIDCKKINGLYAQSNLLLGKELEKNQARIAKLQQSIPTTRHEYQQSLAALADVTDRWNSEWRYACDRIQELEEDKMSFLKSNLWNYTNIVSTNCVSDDAACENVRLGLEKCSVEDDIVGFIKAKGTGNQIFGPPTFVNYLEGEGGERNREVRTADFQTTTESSSEAPVADKTEKINAMSAIPDLRARTAALNFNETDDKANYPSSPSTLGSSLMSGAEAQNPDFSSSLGSSVYSNSSASDTGSYRFSARPEIQKTAGNAANGVNTGNRGLNGNQIPVNQAANTPVSPSTAAVQKPVNSTVNSFDNSYVQQPQEEKKSRNFFVSPFRRRKSTKNSETSQHSNWHSRSKSFTSLISPPNLEQENSTQMLKNLRPQAISSSSTSSSSASTIKAAPVVNSRPEMNSTASNGYPSDPLRHALEKLSRPAESRGFNGYAEELRGPPDGRYQRFVELGRSKSSGVLNESFHQAETAQPVSLDPFRNYQQQQQHQQHQQQLQQQQQQQLHQFQQQQLRRPKSYYDGFQTSHTSAVQQMAPQSSPAVHHPGQQYVAETQQTSRRASRPRSLGYEAPRAAAPAVAVRPLAANGLPLFTRKGVPVIRHARASYDYRAAIPQEVSFRKKDIILIVRMQEDGWWEGEILSTGEVGLVPSNYLAPV